MLPHLASRLFGTPLLVHRAKLDVLLAVMGERLGVAAPAVDLALPAPKTSSAVPPGIAVIPIYGTLVKRALGLDAASGLTSYGEIAVLLEAALADPTVNGIVLDIDSPGGEASGSFELARRVRGAAAIKPIWAVANDAAYSAAYAMACSASRLLVSETGGVGSIGVIALHVDQSVKDANAGYRYTAITAGAHKNDYSPHHPLSDAAKSELQGEVDRLYAMFTEHVAAMRGLALDDVRATEAGLYFGHHAVSQGLADGVQSLDATLADFHQFLNARNRPPSPVRGVIRAETAPPEKEMIMPDAQNLIEPRGVDDAATTALATQAREDARREMAQSARAIAELCVLAGCPAQAADFIAAGTTETEVRRVLIEARAAQADREDIRSTITADAGTAVFAPPEASPIVAAVKKLTARG